MANHKSAEKRARQTICKDKRNACVKKEVRTTEKKVLDAIEQKDLKTAQELLSQYTSTIRKASGKKTYHWKTAARKTSRLAKKLNTIKK